MLTGQGLGLRVSSPSSAALPRAASHVLRALPLLRLVTAAVAAVGVGVRVKQGLG